MLSSSVHLAVPLFMHPAWAEHMAKCGGCEEEQGGCRLRWGAPAGHRRGQNDIRPITTLWCTCAHGEPLRGFQRVGDREAGSRAEGRRDGGRSTWCSSRKGSGWQEGVCSERGARKAAGARVQRLLETATRCALELHGGRRVHGANNPECLNSDPRTHLIVSLRHGCRVGPVQVPGSSLGPSSH